MKNICVDARLLGYYGIGSYLDTLIKNLPCENVEYTLIVRKEIPNLRNGFKQIVFNYSPFSLRGMLGFRFAIPSSDLLVFPHIYIPFFLKRRMRKIATIHDLVLLSSFSHLKFLEKKFAKFLIAKILKKFDRILTVSNFSKREIEKAFGVSEKLFVVHNGVGTNAKKIDKLPTLPAYFFLCFYSEKPYKNFSLVLEAFKKIKDKLSIDLYLIVVGNYQSTDSKIMSFFNVTGETLKSFYAQALGVIIPSFYEGFGMPAIEAMNVNCPVLASDIPSLREVCDEAAIYFDPRLISSLCNAMLLAIHEPIKREEKIEMGKKRRALFTAEKMAKEHFSLFKSLV